MRRGSRLPHDRKPLTEAEIADARVVHRRQHGKRFSRRPTADRRSNRSPVSQRGRREHIHGGLGYVEESAVPRFYRDAKILTIGEETCEILRYVIGPR